MFREYLKLQIGNKNASTKLRIVFCVSYRVKSYHLLLGTIKSITVSNKNPSLKLSSKIKITNQISCSCFEFEI